MTIIINNIEDLNKNHISHPYKVIKKPITLNAFRITWDDFEVETPEGTMKGERGDWLMIGVNGEFYICKNTIFEMSYNVVESPD